MTDEPELSPERIVALSKKIAEVFEGEHSLVIGGVLADLTAIWLAGHSDERGAAETKRVREHMLKVQTKMVRRLIGPNEDIIEGRRKMADGSVKPRHDA